MNASTMANSRIHTAASKEVFAKAHQQNDSLWQRMLSSWIHTYEILLSSSSDGRIPMIGL